MVDSPARNGGPAGPAGGSAGPGSAAAPMSREPDLDAELVSRSKNGDLEAFEELVRRHQRPLFAYLYRLAGEPNEAEEMTQAALVKAWKALPGFRGHSSFKTWLYRIATNHAINRVKRRKPEVELSEFLSAPPEIEPDEVFRRRQRAELVQAALEQLPPDQRAALAMATWDGMSYREIARALGKTERAVDSLLFRARSGVRRLLGPARRKGLV